VKQAGRGAMERVKAKVSPPALNGVYPVPERESDECVIVRASEVSPRPVEWLWKNRIPLGKLTTFAGIGGLGKTFVLVDIAARVTLGAPWPDERGCAPKGQVLFISGEDEPDDTIVPRLMRLGGDRSKFVFLTTAAQDRFTLAHLELLNKAIDQIGDDLRLVVIDPPTAYLGGVNDHKNAELRQLLTPLKELAAARRVSIIFNTHFSKPAGHKVEAAMRIMGSVAWSNAVRAAHVFTKDPDDKSRRLFIPVKSNLGPMMKGIAFRVRVQGDEADLEWLGEVETDAEDAVNPQPKERRDMAAARWLIEKFREKREWHSDDLFKAGQHENVHRNAIFEGKKLLKPEPYCTRRTMPNGNQVWVWRVDDDWPCFLTPKATGTVETVETLGGIL